MPDVTCVGLVVADIVGKPVESLPERGRLLLLDRIELHSGGCAANTAIALARLGVRTAILGKVGRDGFGDFLIDCFQSSGIDASGVTRDATHATSATMVLGHGDGERSFMHSIGANGALCLDDIDFDTIRRSKILHIAGALLMPELDGEPMADLLRRAQSAGVITTFDTVWDPRGLWMRKIGPCLPHIDYFLPSFEEARMLADGQDDPACVAQFLLERGVRVVGLKLGDRGSYVQAQGQPGYYVPACPVETVDALGAGDAYVAGFIAGLDQGWNLVRCARLATAVGGCCVTALGSSTGILNFDQTVRFMEKHFPI